MDSGSWVAPSPSGILHFLLIINNLELGADYFDRRQTDRVRRRAEQTLDRQGYRVLLKPAA